MLRLRPTNPPSPFSASCCGHRQQPHDLSPLMSLVRARGESQRHLLALMGLKMSHRPHGLRVQRMLVEKKNAINTENMRPVVLPGFRCRRSTCSAEKLSLGNRSVLRLEADGETFLRSPWPWPHCACSGGRTTPVPPRPPTLSSQTPAERVLTEPPPVTPTSQEPEIREVTGPRPTGSDGLRRAEKRQKLYTFKQHLGILNSPLH